MSNNDINLLQQTSVTVSKSFTQNTRLIRTISLVILFIVPTGTILLFLLIFFSPQAALQQQESVLLAQADTLGKKVADVEFINDRAIGSSQLIAKRLAYTKALQEMISNLPPTVTISTLTTGGNSVVIITNSVSLDALSSYQTSLLAVPKSQQVLKNITFQTIALSQDNSNFQMTLKATVQ